MFILCLVKYGLLENPLNGIEHPVLVESKKGEGKNKSFFTKTKNRGKKNIFHRIESLTA